MITMDSSIPAGFEPFPPYGGYGEAIGPIYRKTSDDEVCLALRVSQRHCGSTGIVHGGLIASLLDTAFAHASRKHSASAHALVTLHLSVDYVGSAKVGDWIEAQVDVLRAGARVIFLNCNLWNAERLVARGSAQFLVVSQP
jgi:uncharacterized protein (TIGR00369 family)